jgi:macrolide transport system ATP-binding/permease protein
MLKRLGLGDRLGHRPSQLSGGQQQRVSIARALINGGSLILADEPTGALDSRASSEVIALLSELAMEGHTVVLITHDCGVAEAADRIVEIADGAVVADSGSATLDLRDSRRSAQAATGVANSGASLIADTSQTRRGLAASPIRTALTLIGIIIGVAAVIALMPIGEGTKQTVLEEISS